MSSENLFLVGVGVTLFVINAYLGAPIASKIAKVFGRIFPSDTGQVASRPSSPGTELPDGGEQRPVRSGS
jgi:hypothetical protein